MAMGPCFNEGYIDCELTNKGRKPKSNEHHIYFPAYWYATELEIAFRDLPEHKIQMCICAHDELHRRTQPPEKPSVAQMIGALSVEFVDDVW
jgi:hypothetical protein